MIRGFIFFSLIFCLLLGGLRVDGQETLPGERCQTTHSSVQKRIEADPAYARFHRKYMLSLTKNSHPRNPGCLAGPVIIPVAVHFDADIVPPGQEECAINLVEEQLNALNDEINGADPQNSAYTPLQGCFPGSPEIGESCISFCLAKYDHPPGYGLQPGSPAITFGQINFDAISPGSSFVPIDENWSSYLNIFITDLPGGLLGESAGIPGMFNGEGVVIDACAFGTGVSGCSGMNTSYSCGGIYNEGNTLVHEIGHYMGLYHIWGDNSFCTGFQDGIEDTPAMTSSYAGYNSCNHDDCSDLPASCDSKDMYMNYMSYAADGCMYMFTSGQSEVMYLTADNAGFSEQTPIKCISPQFPVANFSFEPNPIELCPNLPYIQLYDASSGPAETWSWVFEGCGVLPVTSGIKNPVIQVNNSGVLTVRLTVGNFLGTSQTIEQQIPVEILDAENQECTACHYQLALHDSYGDGWNGAQVEIRMDGQSAGFYTINAGTDAVFDLLVSSLQNLELYYIGGLWDEEVSFSLKDALNTEIFQQGPNPPDGLLYSGLSNCSVCGYAFLDSGGLSGQYKNSESNSRTFCPPAYYDKVSVNFAFLDIELQQDCLADHLKIYNGNNEDELISEICGFGPEPPVSSTANNGCLHFVFTSDQSVIKQGWIANLQCGHHCNMVTSIADSGPNTLRSAIECVAPGDTVFIHPFLFGDTIMINSGPILIDKAVTIMGQTGSITINSEEITMLFHILPSGNLRIEEMAITGKSSPGSPVIFNEGQLYLNNISLTDAYPGTSITIQNQGLLQTAGLVNMIKSNE